MIHIYYQYTVHPTMSTDGWKQRVLEMFEEPYAMSSHFDYPIFYSKTEETGVYIEVTKFAAAGVDYYMLRSVKLEKNDDGTFDFNANSDAQRISKEEFVRLVESAESCEMPSAATIRSWTAMFERYLRLIKMVEVIYDDEDVKEDKKINKPMVRRRFNSLLKRSLSWDSRGGCIDSIRRLRSDIATYFVMAARDIDYKYGPVTEEDVQAYIEKKIGLEIVEEY